MIDLRHRLAMLAGRLQWVQIKVAWTPSFARKNLSGLGILGSEPKEVVVNLGFRCVDRENPRVEIIHRGSYETLTKQKRRWA